MYSVSKFRKMAANQTVRCEIPKNLNAGRILWQAIMGGRNLGFWPSGSAVVSTKTLFDVIGHTYKPGMSNMFLQ